MKLTYILIAFCFLAPLSSEAQATAGDYTNTGYFFHPTSPRALTGTAAVTLVSPNVYSLQLGDLAGFTFQFTVDGTNNLVNWVAGGSTPAAPASGFMTSDNPGAFTFTVTPGPGTAPYLQSTYNNTYDPATKTFYLHYGYTTGSTGQNGYTRQVYQKLVYIPAVDLVSATPLSGNITTPITITGHVFTGVDPTYGVTFGSAVADSVAIVDDNTIIAWPGRGATGDIKVVSGASSASLPGFTYIPIAAVTDPLWQNVGAPGFSSNPVNWITMASDHHNNPYVAFEDTVTKKGMVMKYDGSSWSNVGPAVSDNACTLIRVIVDSSDHPIVAYKDSPSGFVMIKRYDGSAWVDLALPAALTPYSIAIDKNNIIYVASIAGSAIAISRYDGSSWTVTPNIGSSAYNDMDLTVDTATNVPYILFQDANTQATVMKLSGASWTTVGNAGFTNSVNGIFYPVIRIDHASNPVVTFQEDNGFERLSAYKLSGGAWNPIGSRYFSKGHSFYPSLVLDKLDSPYVAFADFNYNINSSTLRSFSSATNSWDTVGRRGGVPGSIQSNAMVITPGNNIFICFTDTANSRHASVMKLVKPCNNNVEMWTGAVDNTWENPGNWACGFVPLTASNVMIPAGAVVVLSTDTTVHSVNLASGGSLTVANGVILTVLSP